MSLDAFDAAGVEVSNDYEYYGKILIDCAFMVFPGEKGSGVKPVPYDPQAHQGLRPFVQIDMQLDALPECKVQYAVKGNWPNYSQDWNKITMPSIRALGFVKDDGGLDLKKFNGTWVKCTKKTGYRKNQDPTKENYKTLVFLSSYATEQECHDAFETEHGSSAGAIDAEMGTGTVDTGQGSGKLDPAALAFVAYIVKEKARELGSDEVKVREAVKAWLAANADTCKGLTVETPEVEELIMTSCLPF